MLGDPLWHWAASRAGFGEGDRLRETNDRTPDHFETIPFPETFPDEKDIGGDKTPANFYGHVMISSFWCSHIPPAIAW